MKRIFRILVPMFFLSILACGVETQTAPSSELQELPSPKAREFKTKTGKTVSITESHPIGMSLSNIEVTTKDFEQNFQELFEDKDPISEVLVADLDRNGYDEIYIITAGAGSGSYGNILGFASNQDNSLSMIHFVPVEEGNDIFEGYMGHDSFQIENQKLLRTFPVYKPGDTNQKATGGTRRIFYRLYPGEAMWQLAIESTEIRDQ